MRLPLRGNAGVFEQALLHVRVQLVAARRMRIDSNCDVPCDRILAALDVLLDVTQSGETEQHWRQRVMECGSTIMAEVIDYKDDEWWDFLTAAYRELQDVGIL
ncbi:hypothetical protein B7R78_0010325 [Ralstonia solanacearum]|uniref:hypothetical protein n=1 Tax=Ralstonia solanacearum species complex TaxID=3116862 RepID=UPI00114028D5|nr:hypothetical protein [Ralstonia solanacearum]MBT1537514.1 hypothetical protein [Ralstonia solanacearum]